MAGPSPGGLTRIRILSAALLLLVSLIACSQAPQSPVTPGNEPSSGADISDPTKRSEQASGVSSGSQAETAVAKSGGRPPVIEKVTLEPASPVTGEQLRASVHAKDLDGKEIRVW